MKRLRKLASDFKEKLSLMQEIENVYEQLSEDSKFDLQDDMSKIETEFDQLSVDDLQQHLNSFNSMLAADNQ